MTSLSEKAQCKKCVLTWKIYVNWSHNQDRPVNITLRDVFGVMLNLELYEDDELQEIIMRSANILNVKIDEAGAAELRSAPEAHRVSLTVC